MRCPAGEPRGPGLPRPLALPRTRHARPPAPPQVTPDQYLNTEPFMDAIAKTFAKKLNAKL
jgi:hypothetical protein